MGGLGGEAQQRGLLVSSGQAMVGQSQERLHTGTG